MISGLWIAWKQPTYAAPPGDEIDILLELAGVFPDNYGIQWRQHGALRSADPDAQTDPSLLRGALFMHNLTTAEIPSDGAIYIEVAYRYYAADHEIAANEGTTACMCHPPGLSTSCRGTRTFDNYEFTLSVDYNESACANSEPNAKRVEEFGRAMQTADRLIGLYLEPLRRKPRWL